MAIASPTQPAASDDAAIKGGAPKSARRSRFRPWMAAPILVLALALGIGGYYALLIRDAFSTIHTLPTPAASISGSSLGGPASLTIDTRAAQTAVAQAAAGIPTPSSQAPAAAASPIATTGSAKPSSSFVTSSPEPAGAPSFSADSMPAESPTVAVNASPTPAQSSTATATPSVTPSAIERVVNGGLENDDLSAWYLQGGAGVTSNHVHGGDKSIELGNGGYAGQHVFFVPGSTYQLTFWARMRAGGQSAQAGVTFRDANDAKIDDASEPLVTIEGTAWVKRTITYTAPADAASVEIHFWNPSKRAAYVDDVSVRGLVSTDTTIAGGSATSNADETNILLMGVDARAGESIDSGVRPDSLMVLHLDNKTGTCRVLAIPRDTRTDLPGYGQTKINHALAVGGVDYETLVVQNLLGIKIDHFVLIDFNGFQSLVDAVGGVDVTVPADFTSTDGTAFTAGAQKMSGKLALSYARYRGGPDGDFGRIQRQQQVLRALVAKSSGLNVVRSLNELLPAVEQNLRTDLSVRDMASLASDYRSRCTDQNVTMMTLDGITATYQDPLLNLPLNYVIVDPEEIRSKVAALLER